MCADFAGQFAEVAAAFTRTGKGTRGVYPNDEGCYIAGSGGYLNFAGLRDIYAPASLLAAGAGGGSAVAVPDAEAEAQDLERRNGLPETRSTRSSVVACFAEASR